MSFSWTCPFCNHKATIKDDNASSQRHEFDKGSKYGYQALQSHVIVCPNEDCLEYTLSVTLHNHVKLGTGNWEDEEAKEQWNLIPQSEAKVMPGYVPPAVTSDYSEACAIKDLSAKASATLSRRCLQGMIRDFWGVRERDLYLEIEAIQDRVDPATWAAIDAVRKIGNIGAHMEADINLIVDVDAREAGLLIELIETLINDWYVVREERAKRMAAIVAVSEEKKEAKKSPAE